MGRAFHKLPEIFQVIARSVAKMTLHYFQIMLMITYCVVVYIKRLKQLQFS